MARAAHGRPPPPPMTVSAWLRWDAIRRLTDAVAPGRVVEIGAGQGAMGWRLAATRAYDGVEPDASSAAVARARLAGLRSSRVLTGTSDHRDLDPPYDLVCGFEVLEHIEDDGAELRRWHDLLRPGGHVVLSVPAHRARFGPSDEAVGHLRRYDRADLLTVLADAGFGHPHVEVWGAGLGHALDAVRHMLARRRSVAPAEEASAGSGRWLQPASRGAGWFTATVAAPFRLMQRPLRGTSFGIGWVASGVRPG